MNPAGWGGGFCELEPGERPVVHTNLGRDSEKVDADGEHLPGVTKLAFGKAPFSKSARRGAPPGVFGFSFKAKWSYSSGGDRATCPRLYVMNELRCRGPWCSPFEKREG
jgi:hypothetical protein